MIGAWEPTSRTGGHVDTTAGPNTQTPDRPTTDDRPINFFISRAGPDKAIAWDVAKVLIADGHRVVVQDQDFVNNSFMDGMHRALVSGARTVAILSPDYLDSKREHCAAEWQATIQSDPFNRRQRLIVLRVRPCAPVGLLSTFPFWDASTLAGSAASAGLFRDVVLASIRLDGRLDALAGTSSLWKPARALLHPEIRATPSFTGRESELLKIDGALWGGETAAITQAAAVHGLGGIGKSTLAREYAWQARDGYAGVWWLNAAKAKDAVGFDGIERGLVELGATYIPGLDQAQDRAAAAKHTLDFIANGGFAKPWLLIFDNVDDTRALKTWAPPGNAHVLVTSRLGAWGKGVAPVEVEVWAMDEAVRYLRDDSGRDDFSEAELTSIATELGRLPLALSHAAAYLKRRQNVTAAAYVAGLGRHMGAAPKDAEYDRAVFATFMQAVEEAEAEARGARAVVSLAAFFGPDAIPEELFRQQIADAPPELAAVLADASAFDDALGALDHLSLVNFEPAGRTFSVHRLVQAAARDALVSPSTPDGSPSPVDAEHRSATTRGGVRGGGSPEPVGEPEPDARSHSPHPALRATLPARGRAR